MSESLFITATEARSGKSVISLGVMEMLLRKIQSAVFFRPIINDPPTDKVLDNDIHLLASHFNLAIPYEHMYGLTRSEVNQLMSLGKEGEVIDGIIKKYSELEKRYGFVLCEGTDLTGSTASFEFDINAEISRNLGCPVLLVADAYLKTLQELMRSVELAFDLLDEKGCRTVAVIANRIYPEHRENFINLLREKGIKEQPLISAIPYEESLGRPTVGEIGQILGAEVLYGEEQLNRHVYNFTVAAMQLANFLPRIEYGSLIITPGDRADVIVACLAAVSSASMEKISGILLTGGLKPERPIQKLIEGFPRTLPILCVQKNTFPTAQAVNEVYATISADDDRKITRALSLFEKNVDVARLSELVIKTSTSGITPKMFEYELLQRARENRQHIVLPEGEEERILRTAETLLRREVADITLLGDVQVIRERIALLGLRMQDVNIVDPVKNEYFDNYVQSYFELRKHKGITLENAHDIMRDVNFFGTMMIYQGHADGMVSGSVHTTIATVRPALEIIKTEPGFSIVSSVFFMCLANRVLVYGDCAVNPDPDAKQLAEIAISSAQTAKIFGIEPIVAMLSYSTGESGKGTDVEKVHEATRIAKQMARESYPGLRLDGPIQYDAAIEPEVAKTKMPGSDVAGKATVFIFPDLNTGNNTYKAVQRSARAVAIGPVLQGLRRPVNDLSRGCTIPDIFNTVAITAIQAQSR